MSLRAWDGAEDQSMLSTRVETFTSKIVPKNPIPPTNPIRESIQKTNHQFSSTPNLSQSWGSGFAFYSSPNCRILGFEFGLKQSQYSPFLHGIKRYYSVDRSKVNHFRSRGPRRWYKNPRIVLTVTLVDSGVLITVNKSRMEMGADYIGLLLMASAGYEPRVASKVYEKLGKVSGDSALRDYLSTYPSGKKRAQLLARAEVMEEALALYREAIAGRVVEGFFL